MTNHERKEGQPAEKEKKVKSIKSLNTFREIWKALKEWLLTDEQRQELGRRKDGLIDKFHAETDYGRKTQEKNQEVSGVLEKALDELQGTSQKEFKGRTRNTQETIRKKREEAKEHWENEPQDLDEKYKEIAKYELSQIIERAEKKQEEIEGEKRKKTHVAGEIDPDVLTEAEIQAGEKSGEKLNPQEKEAIAKNNEALARKLNDFLRNKTLRGYGYTPDQIAQIKSDPLFREQEFERFFQRANAQPDRLFWDTVDQEAHIKLGQFLQALSDPELGRRGSNILARYSAEFTLRSVFHNVAYAVEYNRAIKPRELPDHVGTLASHHLEFLFTKPWVAKAARLYEKGFEKLLDEDGFVRGERVCVRPIRVNGEEMGISELDEWVYDQMIKSFEKEGVNFKSEEEKEWQLRRAMALGKQHGIFTMALVRIAARGRLPSERDPAGRSVSPWAEDYVRIFDAFEHYFEKFKVGDAVMSAFYFILTDKLPYREKHEDLLREFGKLRNEKNKRFADIVNLLGAKGPETTWRTILAARPIEDERLRFLGSLRLVAETDRLGEEIKNGDFDKEGLLLKETLEDPEWGAFLTEKGNENLEKRLEVFKGKFPAFKERLEVGEASKEEIKEMKAITEKIQEFRRRIIWRDLLNIDPLMVVREGEVAERVRSQTRFTKEEVNAVRDEINLLSEIAVSKHEEKIKPEEYTKDPELRGKVRKYLDVLKEVVTKKEKKDGKEKDAGEKSVIERLAEKKPEDFELGFSTGNVDWELLEFAKAGPAAYHRNLRDTAAADLVRESTTAFLNKWPELKSEEAIAQALYENVCVPIRAYSNETAEGVTKFFAEGLSRFYISDGSVRLAPWPIGWLRDIYRRNSAAEKLWGEAAMAWFKPTERRFISTLAGLGGFGSESNKKAEELFNRLKARNRDLALEYLCRFSPLGFFMMLVLLFKEAGEEVKKALEETA